ncbi:MAG: hypothetical protein QOD88_4915 [Mycobacterium sp.]|jgi:hypothetical protein|nr:hypothetical protein [Mycobacterium sp.]MDT5322393.1 hypothetical protein [Mycobacterium sp.]
MRVSLRTFSDMWGRSVVVTALVHVDLMVEDRAKVSDHIGDDPDT